jgi:cytochrome P450
MTVTVNDLSGLSLFERCSLGDLDVVAAAISSTRMFGDGELICAEGTVADRWWIVVDGTADVTCGGLYVATIGPGETIGELALLDGEPRNATVRAVTDLVAHEVDGAGFVDALLARPALGLAIARELAQRLRDADATMHVPATRRHISRVAPRVAAREETSVVFDPVAPEYAADPLVQLGPLREAAAVHYVERTGSFLVLRYDDVYRLSRDRTMTVSIDHARSTPAIDAERARVNNRPGRLDKTMLRRDGDDHTRLRRLVSKAFTPRAINEWRERATTIVDGLLADADAHDQIDVIADYGLPLPAQVISEMLGMPTADIPRLRGWSHAMTKTLDPLNSPEDEAAAHDAARSMYPYIEDVIADKRQHPTNDILSALIAAEEQGDQLDNDELVAQVVLLYIAGHETTVNLIGNGLTHLFGFPDQLDALRADHGLDTNAVEELLRFDSPAQYSRRINLDPIEIGHTGIPAGSVVSLVLASANHDPRKWGPTADIINVARPGANEHVSFGGGAHHCLGAALARLEGQVALTRLVRRFPNMTPIDLEPAWAPRMVLRGVETLRVALR